MLESDLGRLCSEYSAIKGTVDQRLKWAVGANPGLQEVVDQAAGEQAALVEAVKQFGVLVNAITSTGEACLQFEALRTSTAEARASDHQFLGILSLCRESCVAASEASNTAVGLSPEEMHLLDLNPPKDRVDKFWIRQTENLIAERVKAVQEAAAGQNRKFSELARVIQEQGGRLKDVCTVHHKLMADVADYCQDGELPLPCNFEVPRQVLTLLNSSPTSNFLLQVQGIQRGGGQLG